MTDGKHYELTLRNKVLISPRVSVVNFYNSLSKKITTINGKRKEVL